ncbi:5-3 exoribonuclease 2 [Phaffia rhodozyma]|uniref:5'-3' exoribonuclease n=1 Tax=Phaffia rhodozyma TaxID=264483 RepID=A0A0F7SIS8_PHARH|nr:5-3 exoribonuclease 2 [Phaffia rhodozyma]
MGVPALFRWLSKKYPKIIERVVEEDPVEIPSDEDADKIIKIPVDITKPNPNGVEFDNLYLDMNGIVHPCTHPEGKPAPETEEDMMLEVFAYTERVVNMVRPRKLLFMAIDGVAPRAKMNQQRSRRFRAAQEAADKEQERIESIAMYAAMGHPVSEETKNKKSWDSNAITPGTPFMDLLAASLRYWVVQKMNTDAAWKNIQVIISDASVPGEGEHKIMDFIRRQRSHVEHDPNTQHCIYGLDADLIMLALATHEPHFKVLREDVFFQPNGGQGCRKCGEMGHMAAQCTNDAPPKDTGKPLSETKPFIFLDISILREYLEPELNIPNQPFPFDLERAMDDWIFLIFFVGNDFLPHLPSLEIREGAIDTLLRIWKSELGRLGGYVTNHGNLELDKVQVILEGLAKEEGAIFRRRREMEERQESNNKRRKVDEYRRANGGRDPPQVETTRPGVLINGDELVQVINLQSAPSSAAHPSLPARPGFTTVSASEAEKAKAAKAIGGSNNDLVKNRRDIRMANMSAAEMLKAELSGGAQDEIAETIEETMSVVQDDPAASSDAESRGTKRKADEDENLVDADVEEAEEDGDEAPPVAELTSVPHMDQPVEKPKGRKVNADGTVDAEDTVKLWEPGYQERYYREKFGIELSDKEFRKKLTVHYIEGLSWVLHYYYQGTPSWQWYYPSHFAPFAADFEEVGTMDIKFTLGAPFKPYEQLMGVFPAASKIHIPEVFHPLMTDESSPILDFYPTEFDIDMNGKKMQWQGVALLPFIDQDRLLTAMAEGYPKLSEEDIRRNTSGHDVLFVSDDHRLYDSFCKLYTKSKTTDPVPINAALSGGITGFVLADEACVPGSTFYTPLPSTELGDIYDDRSLSVWYYFPDQVSPHRSVLLKGLKMARKTLNQGDYDRIRRGGNDSGGRRGGGMLGGPGSGAPSYRGGAGGGRGGGRGGYGGNDRGGFSNGGHNGNSAPYNSNSNSATNGGGYQTARGGYSQQGPNRGGYASGVPSHGASYGGRPAPGPGGYGGYGAGSQGGPAPSYGGYGASAGGLPPNPQSYGYQQGPSNQGSYGGYGGYGAGNGGPGGPPAQNRGGYGGYGGFNSNNGGRGGRGGGRGGY